MVPFIVRFQNNGFLSIKASPENILKVQEAFLKATKLNKEKINPSLQFLMTINLVFKTCQSSEEVFSLSEQEFKKIEGRIERDCKDVLAHFVRIEKEVIKKHKNTMHIFNFYKNRQKLLAAQQHMATLLEMHSTDPLISKATKLILNFSHIISTEYREDVKESAVKQIKKNFFKVKKAINFEIPDPENRIKNILEIIEKTSLMNGMEKQEKNKIIKKRSPTKKNNGLKGIEKKKSPTKKLRKLTRAFSLSESDKTFEENTSHTFSNEQLNTAILKHKTELLFLKNARVKRSLFELKNASNQTNEELIEDSAAIVRSPQLRGMIN